MQNDPQKQPAPVAELVHPAVPAPASPAWAKDLRELYNAVVEEPLPDSFMSLLSQLDSED